MENKDHMENTDHISEEVLKISAERQGLWCYNMSPALNSTCFSKQDMAAEEASNMTMWYKTER